MEQRSRLQNIWLIGLAVITALALVGLNIVRSHKGVLFHDTLLETYIETFGSARNAIFRLKENWHCMILLFEGSEKLWKRLRKTTDIAEYRAITAELFATLPMCAELQADW